MGICKKRPVTIKGFNKFKFYKIGEILSTFSSFMKRMDDEKNQIQFSQVNACKGICYKTHQYNNVRKSFNIRNLRGIERKQTTSHEAQEKTALFMLLRAMMRDGVRICHRDTYRHMPFFLTDFLPHRCCSALPIGSR